MRKAISLSLVDQALLSGFNLLLNLAMVRLAGPAELGHLTFALTLVLIFTSLQNALVTMPLSVLLPARTGGGRQELLQDLASFDGLLRLGAAGLALPAALAIEPTPLYLAATALAVLTTLGRELRRAVCIATDRVPRCLAIDAVAVGAAIAVALAIATLAATAVPPATAALLGIAAGNLAATLGPGRGLLPARLPAGQALARYRPYYHDTAWSLAGAATTEVEYRLYVFALQGFRGSEALGHVQAGRLLMGPLNLLAQAWGRVARPELAAALAAGDRGRARRLLLGGLGLVLGLVLAYGLAVLLAWSWLEPLIYKGRYADIGLVTLAWAGYTLVNIVQICLGIVVQAAYRLRELAYVSMGSAALSAVLLLGLAGDVQPLYAVLAITAGEVLGLVWIGLLVLRILGEPGQAPGDRP